MRKEIAKVKDYNTLERLTPCTPHMYFLSLHYEAICGSGGIDHAARQDMHSSRMAVKVIVNFTR